MPQDLKGPFKVELYGLTVSHGLKNCKPFDAGFYGRPEPCVHPGKVRILMILPDTTGLSAARFPDQRTHLACTQALDRMGGPLLLLPLILAEIDKLALS